MTPIAIALNRFGFGYRQGEEQPRDAKAWLRGQIAAYDPAPSGLARFGADQLDVAALVGEVRNARVARQRVGREGGDNIAQRQKEVSADVQREKNRRYVRDVMARMQVAAESETPFMERMVHFWANHFAVSSDKDMILGIVGALVLNFILMAIVGATLGGWIGQLIIGVIGACLLIGGYRAIRRA